MEFSIEEVKLVVEIATLIALIIYVIKTWQMASATCDAAEASKKTLDLMMEKNEEERRPIVDVAIVVRKPKILEFIVINRGKSIAMDVRIKMEPDLPVYLPSKNQGIRKLHSNKIFNEGLKSLPIDIEYTTAFGYSFRYLDNPDNPREFVAKVSYKSTWGKEYKEEIPIDLGFYDSKITFSKKLKPIEEFKKAIIDIIKD